MDNKVTQDIFFFLKFLCQKKTLIARLIINKKTVSREKIFLNFLFDERGRRKRSREDKEKKK